MTLNLLQNHFLQDNKETCKVKFINYINIISDSTNIDLYIEQLCGIDMSIRVSCGQENAMTCRIAGCCWDESTPNSNRTLKCYHGNRAIFMQDRYDTNYGTSSSTTEVIDTTGTYSRS